MPAAFSDRDVVVLTEDVEGEDEAGAARMFPAGTSGAVVRASGGGQEALVEVVRAQGPEWPAAGHRGETVGFLRVCASQADVVRPGA